MELPYGMAFSRLLVAACLISAALAAIGPTADLVLTNGDVAPDGFTRQAVLVNGQVPGPLIAAKKGEEFNLNVIDSLTNEAMLLSTTIHWHGLFQPNNSWADGAAFVSQCPIAANDSFLYTFPTGVQTGTYWYHSHLAVQYCDGLRGPLVIYDPHDPHAHLYDVDDDSTVITLVDWFHAPANSLGPFPTLASTLINGLGRYAGGPTSKLAVISVRKGKRYRMRLLNMACDPGFIFTIDKHSMSIIEADGVETRPLTVDSIEITPAQRYSFVLHANQAIDNYWIRTVADSGTLGFDNGINSAILRYVGAKAVDPCTNQTASTAPLVETALRPLVPTRVPGAHVSGGADVVLNLAIALDEATLLYSINGAVFTPPTVPVLLQILSGAHAATDLLPHGSVYTVPPNKVVEVSIPGGSPDSPHPFHLHGHNFFVIKSAGNDTFNFDNPVIRDTVSTGLSTTDNTTIRFVTDNAGPWFFHCHIDFHLNLGLAIVFAEDTNTIAKSIHPSEWDSLCPTYNALSPDKL
ncbi:laccase [Mycena belliarum]|uniref:Laccase n=1 Tax=Mycena belliarum TaxID=1033014 RepID=A0AAD6TXX2_9AGAR|nr:laccase [Mycena belliae]